MTDTRSPEQRRNDELNLAWVESRQRADRLPPTPQSDRSEQIKAYQRGTAAGLAGWTSRGTPGMDAHEQGCDDAYRAGLMSEWAAGHKEGLALREQKT